MLLAPVKRRPEEAQDPSAAAEAESPPADSPAAAAEG